MQNIAANYVLTYLESNGRTYEKSVIDAIIAGSIMCNPLRRINCSTEKINCLKQSSAGLTNLISELAQTFVSE